MRNLTVTVDEDVLQWARIEAARRGTSVSRLVGEMLRERMRSEARYRDAMERFLSREPVSLKRTGGYPDRGSLHEREGRE